MSGPNLYLIAGCKGAGKTTAAYTLFSEILESYEFVNADEIARELRISDPDTSDIKAGRIMLERINYLINANLNFALETTLASRSIMNFISRAKNLGYYTEMIFFWLNSPELAVERVRDRVLKGGHSIPGDTIVRRYYAGLKNFFDLYIYLVDNWVLYDNSRPVSIFVAGGAGTEIIDIENFGIFETIKKKYNYGKGISGI